MKNVDTKFNQSMEYDVSTSDQTFSTSVASINTRDICFPAEHHNVYPKIDLPEEFRIDTKPFVNRPFFVENILWGNQGRFSILDATTRRLPRDVFTSNLSLENALKLGAYFRSDLSLSISVAGTITHAGTLLAAILPPLDEFAFSTPDPEFLVNTLMSGPHCFLHANEATSSLLHVPWFCNTDVASLDMRPISPASSTAFAETNIPGNYASLVIMVLSPLSPSSGASTSLNITVEATFNALDIYVPSPRYLTYQTQGFHEISEDVYRETTELLCPRDYNYYTQGLQSIASSAIDATTSYTKRMIGDAIDELRAGIKYYTGLHNPNIPLVHNRIITTFRNFGNNTTGEQFFEKLDPYPEIDRIVDRPIYNTTVDEMSIKHILSKPQYVGTFRVNAGDLPGKLLWVNAISPRQGGYRRVASNQDWLIANNIDLMHYLSRAWRGSIKIHIQSVMNNKQQVKLRLLQLYNPPAQVVDGYPVYESLLSAPSHLMEFTAGGQVQTITLPYLCRNDLTPCSPDLALDAIFHGLYYIYVAQSMANSDGSPLDINFNVYISGGDDLTFHGYSTEVARQRSFRTGPFSRTVNNFKSSDDVDLEDFVTQGLDVMNSPQDDSVLTEVSTDINMNQDHQERLFSPVDIRPIIRRMYQSTTTTFSSGATVLDLKEFIGEKIVPTPITPMQIVSGMYYGKSAGLKVKIRTFGAVSGGLTIFYVPPQCNVDTVNKVFRESEIGTSPEFSPYILNNRAGYSFPFIEMSNEASYSATLYEFVIPNTSFYKFIGGPNKFTNFNDPADLSISSFGTLVVFSDQQIDASIFLGMTDESRLGFHCIAPIIEPVKSESGNNTIYKGAAGVDKTTDPPVIRPPFLYYARS
jgi:hypothetical protein